MKPQLEFETQKWLLRLKLRSREIAEVALQAKKVLKNSSRFWESVGENFGQYHYILKFYNQDNINEWWAMVHGSSMAKQLPFILCQYQLNGDNNEPIYRGRCNRYNKKQVILRNWDTFAEGAAIRWAGRQAIFLQGNLWLVTTHWSTGASVIFLRFILNFKLTALLAGASSAFKNQY